MDRNSPADHVGDTSMIPGLGEKLAIEGTKLVITHAVPKLTDYGKMFWSGKRFLILGPARSGKSSFLQFLEYLVLEPEKLTGPTVRVVKGEDKILRLGPDGSLILRVKKPRDVPGQDPLFQIQYIRDYKPHCVVIVLDSTKFFGVPDSVCALHWLSQFCALLRVLLNDNKKIASKLKAMIVVMNKWDKIAKAAEAEKSYLEYQEIYEIYVRDVLDATIKDEFYARGGKSIEVVPCALVSQPLFGDGLAKQLVQSIALSLKRQ